MAQKAMHEEIITEIGTQTLARFGLNIFSLDTYKAYAASVSMTNSTQRTYEQHKKNPQGFGHSFEELHTGISNIKTAFFNTGEKTYRTDDLADIRKTQEFLKSGKKIENLNPKDKAKFEFILREFSEEVKNMDFTKLKDFAVKNHETTDSITLDSSGKVVNTSQLKVIKNTEDLLKDKYLENNDKITVPFDDYKKHKENLEREIQNPKTSPEKKAKAEKALSKLNADNFTNRLMCENPRATAIITQTAAGVGHSMQAGMSDAIVVALSTLANGAIYEIKDMVNGKTQTDFMTRIKRLFDKIIKAFKDTFLRGASYGAIDVIVGALSQIFKSIALEIKQLWKAIRAAGKSIFNAFYSYMKGEIKSFAEFLVTIFKAIFSAAVVVTAVGFLEKKLKVFLTPLVSPFVAGFLAPALSIVVGAFAVVYGTRQIEACMGVFFAAAAAKKSYEELEAFYNEAFPVLIKQRKMLEQKIKASHIQRIEMLKYNFAKYKDYIKTCNYDEAFEELNKTNKLFGFSIKRTTDEDLKDLLTDNTGSLKWE